MGGGLGEIRFAIMDRTDKDDTKLKCKLSQTSKGRIKNPPRQSGGVMALTPELSFLRMESPASQSILLSCIGISLCPSLPPFMPQPPR